jgi:hypothetical protein
MQSRLALFVADTTCIGGPMWLWEGGWGGSPPLPPPTSSSTIFQQDDFALVKRDLIFILLTRASDYSVRDAHKSQVKATQLKIHS